MDANKLIQKKSTIWLYRGMSTTRQVNTETVMTDELTVWEGEEKEEERQGREKTNKKFKQGDLKNEIEYFKVFFYYLKTKNKGKKGIF